MELLLAALGGILIGLLIGYLITKSKVSKDYHELTTRYSFIQEKHQESIQSYKQLEVKLYEKEKEITDFKIKLSEKTIQFKTIEEKLNEQKNDIEKINEKLTLQFKNLANDILEEKSKKFTEQNKTSISELLTPLKEKIISFEKKVDESTKENLTWNTALKEQLITLKDLNQKINKEAENLTKALKGDSKVQGNWGEIILERILEKSGLVKNREYMVQESVTTHDGRKLQPDIIIKLPENKNIIIDAKVSLLAYERYSSAENEIQQEKEIKEHIQSLRTHIKLLGSKNYQHEYNLANLDFVLLFIPIEPAFSLAIQKDIALFNEAWEKNIVMVSSSTLLATLRTIASIWRQEYQNRNVLEIAKQSGDLYDKFVGFVDDLLDIGKKIESAQNSYEAAKNKLHEGKGNLINRAEQIKKLGAKTTKSLPTALLNNQKDE